MKQITLLALISCIFPVLAFTCGPIAQNEVKYSPSVQRIADDIVVCK